MKKWTVLTLLIAAAGCGGPQALTEKAMLDWGNVLNVHLGTGGLNGDYAFPQKLDDVDESLRAGLSKQDAWGNDYFYRQIRDDRYHLISAGPDGELGNDDDIVMANSAFYPTAEIYAQYPIKKN